MATWDELELRREFGIGDPFEARVSTPRGRRRAILDDGAIVPSAAPTGAYGSDLSPGDLGRIARRQTPPLAYYAPDLSIGGYPEFIERSRLPLHGGMVVVRFSDKALAIANGAHADLV
jgi:hypothetical protein